MKFFPSYHDFGEKKLFTDKGEQLVISASSGEELSEAIDELGAVLDGLIGHNTTAPFIARRLIQRFVTSNPSPGYIQRVAIAFGETGDMQSVIKAILLDPEARTPSVANSATFGKFKEPLLQLTAVMRLFQANSRLALGAGDEDADILGTNYQYVNHFATGATIIKLGNIATAVGQQAFGAPSVFNFFSPDYSPAGSLASQGLVAPELTLVTESQMYSMLNAYHKFLNNGVVHYSRQPFTSNQVRVLLDTSRLNAVWDDQAGDDIAKATAIVDYLDFYLNSGKLKQTDNQGTRQELITTLQSAACISEPICDRNNLAIYGTATAPEFQIQQ
jgi:hypothetical protein